MHKSIAFFFRNILTSISLVVVVTSCVTNRKVQYLQSDDVNAKDRLIKDSLYRKYEIADNQYKVQSEDIISVRVESLTPEEFDIYNRPGMIGGASSSMNQSGNTGQTGVLLLGDLVDHHGNIPFLLAGSVKVAGLTVYQIQDTLQSIANKYLKNPIVRARLLNYRFTILGEVQKEGLVVVTNNRVSILEAIGLAGGMGELADRSNIKLIRQHDGKAEVYYINLLDERLFDSPLYYAQQNDILIIPPLKQRTFRKYFVPNMAIVLSALSVALIFVSLAK